MADLFGNDAPADAKTVKRVRFLQTELDRHNELYYAKAEPEISDREFDRFMAELSDLERQRVEVKEQLQTELLKSPVRGQVFDLTPTSKGYAVAGAPSFGRPATSPHWPNP